jgi:hypothetical protein
VSSENEAEKVKVYIESELSKLHEELKPEAVKWYGIRAGKGGLTDGQVQQEFIGHHQNVFKGEQLSKDVQKDGVLAFSLRKFKNGVEELRDTLTPLVNDAIDRTIWDEMDRASTSAEKATAERAMAKAAASILVDILAPHADKMNPQGLFKIVKAEYEKSNEMQLKHHPVVRQAMATMDQNRGVEGSTKKPPPTVAPKKKKAPPAVKPKPV